MRIGLVGCGLIGGSLALALRARGARLVGRDVDRRAAERALALGILDEVGDPAGADVDVIVLAVPVRQMAACARELGPIAGAAVVTDVGSTKADVVRAGEALFGARFVGGHPIAGSERAGPDAADPALFESKRVILTPTERTDGAALDRVRALWREVGAIVVEMDAGEHDRVLAAVSHLPHAVAYALAGALGALGAESFRGLAGGGLVDTTRIAATPAAIWIDIFLENRGPVLAALDAFQAELGGLRAAIAGGDADGIRRILEAARAARARILA
jgi:prephenate dehydrogenase